jgi:hypothetical protein
MFEALIIACHVGAASACIKVEDQRGPYKTQDHCETRLAEMTKDLMEMWTQYKLPYVFKGHYCTVITKGENT